MPSYIPLLPLKNEHIRLEKAAGGISVMFLIELLLVKNSVDVSRFSWWSKRHFTRTQTNTHAWTERAKTSKREKIQIGVTDTRKCAASNEKIKRCTHKSERQKALKHFFFRHNPKILHLSTRIKDIFQDYHLHFICLNKWTVERMCRWNSQSAIIRSLFSILSPIVRLIMIG